MVSKLTFNLDLPRITGQVPLSNIWSSVNQTCKSYFPSCFSLLASHFVDWFEKQKKSNKKHPRMSYWIFSLFLSTSCVPDSPSQSFDGYLPKLTPGWPINRPINPLNLPIPLFLKLNSSNLPNDTYPEWSSKFLFFKSLSFVCINCCVCLCKVSRWNVRQVTIELRVFGKLLRIWSFFKI